MPTKKPDIQKQKSTIKKTSKTKFIYKMETGGFKLAGYSNNNNNNSRRRYPPRRRQLSQAQVRRLILLNRFAKLVENTTQQPLSEKLLLSLLNPNGGAAPEFNNKLQPSIQPDAALPAPYQQGFDMFPPQQAQHDNNFPLLASSFRGDFQFGDQKGFFNNNINNSNQIFKQGLFENGSGGSNFFGGGSFFQNENHPQSCNFDSQFSNNNYQNSADLSGHFQSLNLNQQFDSPPFFNQNNNPSSNFLGNFF